MNFDPERDVPGYAKLIYLHQKASERRSRAAEFIARRASGITEMNDAGRAQYEQDLIEYRELYGEA